MNVIPMVDLKAQYHPLKSEIDSAIQLCLESGQFVGGEAVINFENTLASYLGIKKVISCGNGTDALQIALMALQLPEGSKVIVPAFTYIAPLEVITLLGLIPVYADVDPDSFNTTIDAIEKVYTEDVKAIIVVHLFGQSCEMDSIYNFVKEKNIYLIEDNAQSLGAEKNIQRDSIITTSFFPSKNLGAFGDGGAILTNNSELAETCRKIASHGQGKKYHHDIVGINSRLDSIQAAILTVKLEYLEKWIARRKDIAAEYTKRLSDISSMETPKINTDIQHTFHQYTLKVNPAIRDDLHLYLKEKGITTAIYYPLPCYQQEAYKRENIQLRHTEKLCASVLSLPIYPEITEEQLSYICEHISTFFKSR
jgi:dTDP-4-amino-4,6-dideoxygalactose transaminase